MQRSEERDLRQGLVYDPAVKGFDSSWFKGDTANLAFDTVKNRIKIGDTALVGSVSSYSQYVYGDFEFTVFTDCLSPDSNDSEKYFGLRNLGDTLNRGSAFFNMSYDTTAGDSTDCFTGAGTTRPFYAVVFDATGTRFRQRLTFDTNWSSVPTRYRIIWEKDGYSFLINDTVYATISSQSRDTISEASPNLNHEIPQGLRLSNRGAVDTSDTNPMGLSLLAIRNARKII